MNHNGNKKKWKYKQESIAIGPPELAILADVQDKLNLASRSAAVRFILHQWVHMDGDRYGLIDRYDEGE